MQSRWVGLVIGWGLLASVGLYGCPGTLSDPSSFTATAECVGTDVEELFVRNCAASICHDDGDERAAELDLKTPGVAQRILGRPAVGEGCEDRLLIVPGDPDASYLLAKVRGEAGICDEPMPQGAALDPRDIDCIRLWIDLNDGVDGATGAVVEDDAFNAGGAAP